MSALFQLSHQFTSSLLSSSLLSPASCQHFMDPISPVPCLFNHHWLVHWVAQHQVSLIKSFTTPPPCVLCSASLLVLLYILFTCSSQCSASEPFAPIGYKSLIIAGCCMRFFCVFLVVSSLYRPPIAHQRSKSGSELIVVVPNCHTTLCAAGLLIGTGTGCTAHLLIACLLIYTLLRCSLTAQYIRTG